MSKDDADAFSHSFGFSFTDPLGGVHTADVDLSGGIAVGPSGVSGSLGITTNTHNDNLDGSSTDHSTADATAFGMDDHGAGSFAHAHDEADHFEPPDHHN